MGGNIIIKFTIFNILNIHHNSSYEIYFIYKLNCIKNKENNIYQYYSLVCYLQVSEFLVMKVIDNGLEEEITF